MEKIILPFSDIEVTRLGFGAWSIAGGFNWGPQDASDSKAALRAAYDAGITLFDTAPVYGDGRSEDLIAEALKEVRQDIVLATKAAPQNFESKALKAACEERLKALKTDYIDLYQLHWPNRDIPMAETMGALEDLKAAGKIRAYGVSNFGVEDLSTALQFGPEISSNQMPYNLIWRAIEYEILPFCKARNIPILCYSPIMQGLLAGKFANAEEVPIDRARTRHFSKDRPQARHSDEGFETETFDALAKIKEIAKEIGESMADVSMAWLLKQEGVGSILVGARNAGQVQRNIRAADLKLSNEITEQLSTITRPLKELLGKSPDMWQSKSRVR